MWSTGRYPRILSSSTLRACGSLIIMVSVSIHTRISDESWASCSASAAAITLLAKGNPNMSAATSKFRSSAEYWLKASKDDVDGGCDSAGEKNVNGDEA